MVTAPAPELALGVAFAVLDAVVLAVVVDVAVVAAGVTALADGVAGEAETNLVRVLAT